MRIFRPRAPWNFSFPHFYTKPTARNTISYQAPSTNSRRLDVKPRVSSPHTARDSDPGHIAIGLVCVAQCAFELQATARASQPARRISLIDRALHILFSLFIP